LIQPALQTMWLSSKHVTHELQPLPQQAQMKAIAS
jgi:hypothetical protein